MTERMKGIGVDEYLKFDQTALRDRLNLLVVQPPIIKHEDPIIVPATFDWYGRLTRHGRHQQVPWHGEVDLRGCVKLIKLQPAA